MHAGLPKTHASSRYKIKPEEEPNKRGEEKGGGREATARRKTEGRQFRRTWENWEIREIVTKQKGEKRKQTERKQRTRWSRERSTTIVSFFSKPGVFTAFLSSYRMRWCMLVCKIQKENIRKPTPGITSCNTMFFLLFHSRTARKVMNSAKVI